MQTQTLLNTFRDRLVHLAFVFSLSSIASAIGNDLTCRTELCDATHAMPYMMSWHEAFFFPFLDRFG